MAGSSTVASTVGTSAGVSRVIWASRYRALGERTIEDTWRRVARALRAA